MKNRILLTVAILTMAIGWPSCTQEEETGTVQFGLNLSEDDALKSAASDARVAAALVTVQSENGALTYDKEYLPVYKFGDEYTTKSLKIPVGRHRLIEFMLVDSSGVVLWATPVEGSSLAHLVRQPLPIPFSVGTQETTTLSIQVIRVKDHPPSDFGYVNFKIGFVDRFCLKVFYSSRCVEEWPDGLMAPQLQPRLTIHAGDRLILDEPLNPGENMYLVQSLAKWYVITAHDCHGNVVFMKRIPAEELMKHRCADQFEPLVINREQPDILVTPEGMTDPTIKQGVFGTVVVPVDDSTDTERYDTRPVVRDIYFFPYAVLDSIFTFAPMNCYISPEMIHTDPEAIVRSNSDGFFQVPLEAGDYLYLVKENGQFYIDMREAHMSYRRLGHVQVNPEEVTKLMINIFDCSMWQ